MHAIEASLKGWGVLAAVFEKAAEFSSFLFKHRFISNSSFIKHTVWGT